MRNYEAFYIGNIMWSMLYVLRLKSCTIIRIELVAIPYGANINFDEWSNQ